MTGRPSISDMVLNRRMTHFNLPRIPSARQTAEWHTGCSGWPRARGWASP